MDQRALKEAREAAMTTTLDQRALKAPRAAIATQVQRDRKARRLVFQLMRCHNVAFTCSLVLISI
jgi:hypothetical protein